MKLNKVIIALLALLLVQSEINCSLKKKSKTKRDDDVAFGWSVAASSASSVGSSILLSEKAIFGDVKDTVITKILFDTMGWPYAGKKETRNKKNKKYRTVDGQIQVPTISMYFADVHNAKFLQDKLVNFLNKLVFIARVGLPEGGDLNKAIASTEKIFKEA